MALHKRTDYLRDFAEEAWLTWERLTGREYPFVVDYLSGKKEDQLDWLDEQGIDPTTYDMPSNGFVFFMNEADAVLFYLRWGHNANLQT